MELNNYNSHGGSRMGIRMICPERNARKEDISLCPDSKAVFDGLVSLRKKLPNHANGMRLLSSRFSSDKCRMLPSGPWYPSGVLKFWQMRHRGFVRFPTGGTRFVMETDEPDAKGNIV